MKINAPKCPYCDKPQLPISKKGDKTIAVGQTHQGACREHLERLQSDGYSKLFDLLTGKKK